MLLEAEEIAGNQYSVVLPKELFLTGFYDGLEYTVRFPANNTGAALISFYNEEELIGEVDLVNNTGGALTNNEILDDSIHDLVFYDGNFRCKFIN